MTHRRRVGSHMPFATLIRVATRDQSAMINGGRALLNLSVDILVVKKSHGLDDRSARGAVAVGLVRAVRIAEGNAADHAAVVG